MRPVRHVATGSLRSPSRFVSIRRRAVGRSSRQWSVDLHQWQRPQLLTIKGGLIERCGSRNHGQRDEETVQHGVAPAYPKQWQCPRLRLKNDRFRLSIPPKRQTPPVDHRRRSAHLHSHSHPSPPHTPTDQSPLSFYPHDEDPTILQSHPPHPAPFRTWPDRGAGHHSSGVAGDP